MQRYLFAAGAGVAHEHAATLAEEAVYSFDNAGAALALQTAAVLPAQQHIYSKLKTGR